MDREAVLEAFDLEVRREPHAAKAGYAVEREPHVLRVFGDGWAGVAWSELDRTTADAVIAEQVERFAGRRGGWEWKHYSYDQPADLPERLLAAGFVGEPEESVVAAELAVMELDLAAPEGIELLEVRDEAAALALAELQLHVFGDEGPERPEAFLERIAREPAPVAAVVALADGQAVAGGRVEFNLGTRFAGLWGGCTHPRWRSRGIYRALVAHRARLARERGFRYVHVDASAESLPILLRLGFVELAKTTPFTFTSAGS